MAFRFDTRQLSPQTQQIINKRDEEDRRLKENTSIQEQAKKVYPISIFMRLGYDESAKLNGVQTIQVYEKFCKQNNSVWFSTNSLASGMSETKRSEFINAIKRGFTVEIFFAVGKNGGGNNDIKYKAEVLDIKTDAEGMVSPEKALTPFEWRNDKNKILIKIKNLNSEAKLTTKDFIVASTGNVLADSIANSQYQFGYIKRK